MYFISLIPVTISTSTFFDGLLVTGLYTSTSVQASQSVGGSSAFGFGKSEVIHDLQPNLIFQRIAITTQLLTQVNLDSVIKNT